jgi:3-oxoacyl-[acyl-carrier-protein] synthase III
MNDPIDLQDQEQQAGEESRKAQLGRRQQVDDLKWLMAHPQGRRVVTRIFERTGIRRTPFNTNGSTMAFNAGAQNVGLWLEAEIIETTFEGYVKLLKEFQA